MSTRVIKKYANRRLYDTEDSKYVTLKDIKKIIALGQDVQIVDDTNNEDITRGLLLQIVSEQELGGSPILSKAVLKQLIRFYGHPMQDMMSGYLANSVTQFMGQLETMQTQMETLMEASPFANLQEYTAKNMQAMADLQKQFFNPMMKPNKKTKPEDDSDEL
ncbi:MAG: polyhydroxyalkanoate synthesis repressor PhaR [Cellvibrionaceae bacterium]